MNLERYGFHQPPFSRRGPAPFAAVPSRMRPADALEQALRDGSGIAVLTAATGLGKTALCRELERRLKADYLVALLHDAGYTSRRSLLQAVLYELGLPYSGLTEQEARLRLLETIREQHPDRRGLVLIADEAQRLHDRLLLELRSLINHEADGQPLIRLLLCGDLVLEERLISPELAGVNQRVVCHESLVPLSHEESARLIDERLVEAGGDGWEHVFTRAAMELLCLVSDGSPRNLEQLAHRSLQLAAGRREPRISVDVIRAALEELRELPLQWNEPANLDAFSAREVCQDDTVDRRALQLHEMDPHGDLPIDLDDSDHAFAVRVGDELPAAGWQSARVFAVEYGSDAPYANAVPGVSEPANCVGSSAAEPLTEVSFPLGDVAATHLDPLVTRSAAAHVLLDDIAPALQDTAILTRDLDRDAGANAQPEALITPTAGLQPVASSADWIELEVADPYAALDATAPPSSAVAIPLQPRAELPTCENMRIASMRTQDPPADVIAIEASLLREVHEMASDVASAMQPPCPADPVPDASQSMDSPAQDCAVLGRPGFRPLPEWDVVQPEWVADQPFTPVEIDALHQLDLEPLPVESRNDSQSSQVVAAMALRDTDPAAAAETAPAASEPSPAEPAPHAVDSPAPQLRIDDSSQRPYSQLFTRLRRLRSTIRQRAAAQD